MSNASTMHTGLFPLGPLQQVVRDREKVIERLIETLLLARSRAQCTDEAWEAAARLILGDPGTCLACGRSVEIPEPGRCSDLDRWFCSDHCPVCHGWEVVTRG